MLFVLPSHGLSYDITATSQLKEYKGRNYNSKNLLDQATSTAWCAKTNENDLVIALHNYKSSCGKIIIFNGFSKNKSTYLNNSRAKDIEVITDNGKIDVTLTDTQTYQLIDVGLFKDLKIRIKSVYKGGKYDDICLNEIIIDSGIIVRLQELSLILDKNNVLTEEEIKSNIGRVYRKYGNNLLKNLDFILIDKSESGLRFLLNLFYYGKKYDKTLNAELLEGISDYIQVYFVGANEEVYRVLKDSKQRGRNEIVASFENFIDGFNFDEKTNKFYNSEQIKQIKKLKQIVDDFESNKMK